MYSHYLRRGYVNSNVFIFIDRGEVDMSLCVYEEVEENLTVSVYVV